MATKNVKPCNFTVNPTYLDAEDMKARRILLNDAFPFPHMQLTDFISDSNTLNKLRVELDLAHWHRKENDLYSLSQTLDLHTFDREKFPALTEFKTFLETDVRDYLKSLTGLPLNSNVAITGSRYSKTDGLLPHDDSLDERAIAFIIYLTPDWKPEYGGDLAIYNADPTTNRPIEIVKRIPPKENALLFFPVATNTWHRVMEVESADHRRLSLNGWFHVDGKKSADKPQDEEPLPRLVPRLEVTMQDVNSFVNPCYIDSNQNKVIRKRFARQSQLILRNFLRDKCHDQVLAELDNAEFVALGSPDRRNVKRLVLDSLPMDSKARTLIELFRSEAITLLLTEWTNLKLYCPSEPNDCAEPESKVPKLDGRAKTARPDVKLVLTLDKYEHSSYSMADSQLVADAANNGYCLDLMLFIMDCDEWPDELGGFASYMAENDPEEVLRVPPLKNCLGIVFREPGTLFFVKYINCLAGDRHFYVLNVSFFSAYDEQDEASSETDSGESDDFDEGDMNGASDEDDETDQPGSSGL